MTTEAAAIAIQIPASTAAVDSQLRRGSKLDRPRDATASTHAWNKSMLDSRSWKKPSAKNGASDASVNVLVMSRLENHAGNVNTAPTALMKRAWALIDNCCLNVASSRRIARKATQEIAVKIKGIARLPTNALPSAMILTRPGGMNAAPSPPSSVAGASGTGNASTGTIAIATVATSADKNMIPTTAGCGLRTANNSPGEKSVMIARLKMLGSGGGSSPPL